MSFFGPTLGQLGADPNSQAVTGIDQPAPSAQDGSFLNELGGLFGSISGAVATSYRAINTPTTPTALNPGQSYLLPGGRSVTAPSSTSSILLIAVIGFLVVLGIKLLRK